jgi:transcriptional regulator with XRE-family HTH domain
MEKRPKRVPRSRKRGPSLSTRKPSKEFGEYLKTWRETHHLTQEQAALLLGIQGKDPAAYLSLIENGKKALPDDILPKLSEVYDVHPEEVLRRAYWPQLVLLPLFAIVDMRQVTSDIIDAMEKGFRDAERRELTNKIKEILSRRNELTHV